MKGNSTTLQTNSSPNAFAINDSETKKLPIIQAFANTPGEDKNEVISNLLAYKFFSALRDTFIIQRDNSEDDTRNTYAVDLNDNYKDLVTTLTKVEEKESEAYTLEIRKKTETEEDQTPTTLTVRKGVKSHQITITLNSNQAEGNALDDLIQSIFDRTFETVNNEIDRLPYIAISNIVSQSEYSLVRAYCMQQLSLRYSSYKPKETTKTSSGLQDATGRPKVSLENEQTEKSIGKLSEIIAEVANLEDSKKTKEHLESVIKSVQNLDFGRYFSENALGDLEHVAAVKTRSDGIISELLSSLQNDNISLEKFIINELLTKLDSIRDIYLKEATYKIEIAADKENEEAVLISEKNLHGELSLVDRNKKAEIGIVGLTERLNLNKNYQYILREAAVADIVSQKLAQKFHEKKESSQKTLTAKLERFSLLQKKLESDQPEVLEQALLRINSDGVEFFSFDEDSKECTITFDSGKLSYASQDQENLQAKKKTIRQNREFLQDVALEDELQKLSFKIKPQENGEPIISFNIAEAEDELTESTAKKPDYFDVERIIDYATLLIRVELAAKIADQYPEKIAEILTERGITIEKSLEEESYDNFLEKLNKDKDKITQGLLENGEGGILETFGAKISEDLKKQAISLILLQPTEILEVINELDKERESEISEKIRKIFNRANDIASKVNLPKTGSIDEANIGKELITQNEDGTFVLDLPEAKDSFHTTKLLITDGKIKLITESDGDIELDPNNPKERELLNKISDTIDSIQKDSDKKLKELANSISAKLERIIGTRSKLTLSLESPEDKNSKYYISEVKSTKGANSSNPPLELSHIELVEDTANQDAEDERESKEIIRNVDSVDLALENQHDDDSLDLTSDPVTTKIIKIEGVGAITLSKNNPIIIESEGVKSSNIEKLQEADAILESYIESQQHFLQSQERKLNSIYENFGSIANLTIEDREYDNLIERELAPDEDTAEYFDHDHSFGQETDGLPHSGNPLPSARQKDNDDLSLNIEEVENNTNAASLYGQREALVLEIETLQSGLSEKRQLLKEFSKTKDEDTNVPQDEPIQNELKANCKETDLETAIKRLSAEVMALENAVISALKTETQNFLDASKELFISNGTSAEPIITIEIEEEQLTLKLSEPNEHNLRSISVINTVISQDDDKITENDNEDLFSQIGDQKIPSTAIGLSEDGFLLNGRRPEDEALSSSEIFTTYIETTTAVFDFIEKLHKSKLQKISQEIFGDDSTQQKIFDSGSISIKSEENNQIELHLNGNVFDLGELKIDHDASATKSKIFDTIADDKKRIISSSDELLTAISKRKEFLTTENSILAPESNSSDTATATANDNELSLIELQRNYDDLLGKKLGAIEELLSDCRDKDLLNYKSDQTGIEGDADGKYTFEDITINTAGDKIEITPSQEGATFNAETLVKLEKILKSLQEEHKKTHNGLLEELGKLRLFKSTANEREQEYKVDEFVIIDGENSRAFKTAKITKNSDDTFKIVSETTELSISGDKLNIDIQTLKDLAKQIRSTQELENKYLDKIKAANESAEAEKIDELSKETDANELEINRVKENLHALYFGKGEAIDEEIIVSIDKEEEHQLEEVGAYSSEYYNSKSRAISAERTLASKKQLEEAALKQLADQVKSLGSILNESTHQNLFKKTKSETNGITSDKYEYSNISGESITLTFSYKSDGSLLPLPELLISDTISPTRNEEKEQFCIQNADAIITKVLEAINSASTFKQKVSEATQKINPRQGLYSNPLTKTNKTDIPSNLSLKSMWQKLDKLSSRWAFQTDETITNLTNNDKKALNYLIDNLIEKLGLEEVENREKPVSIFAQIYRDLCKDKSIAPRDKIVEVYSESIKALTPSRSPSPSKSSSVAAAIVDNTNKR